MKFLTCTLILFSLYFSGFSQESQREFEMKEGDTTYVMKQYVFVMLTRGDQAQDFSESELADLQKGHMENMNRLAEEGYLHLAGPFGDDGDWRGILILDVASLEEAEKMIQEDPAVQAGRLSYQMHPWWGAKGTCIK